MTQFHEGQEVEVLGIPWPNVDGAEPQSRWRKAKIIPKPNDWDCTMYQVQFPDGIRAVFDAAHIRTAKSSAQKLYDEVKGRAP